MSNFKVKPAIPPRLPVIEIDGKLYAVGGKFSLSEDITDLVGVSGGGNGDIALEDLSDFTLTELSVNDALIYNGEYFTNSGVGTAAFSDVGDFATAAQGSLAESALQPGDVEGISGALISGSDISSLVNDVGYALSGSPISSFTNDSDYLVRSEIIGDNGWLEGDIVHSGNNPETFNNHYMSKVNISVSPLETITNENFIAENYYLQYDPFNTGVDYGTYSGTFNTISLFTSNFQHNGSGLLESLAINNDAVELGLSTVSGGVTKMFHGNQLNLNVRENHTVDFLKLISSNINIETGATVTGLFIGNEHGIVLREDVDVPSGITSARYSIATESGSTLPHSTGLNLGWFGDGAVGYVTGLQMHLRPDNSVTGIIGLDMLVGGETSSINSSLGINLNMADNIGPLGVGIRVNMGNYDIQTERRSGIECNNGNLLVSQTTATTSNLMVDNVQLLNTNVIIPSGSAISGTDLVATNLNGNFSFAGDVLTGPLGLGFCSSAAVGQIEATPGTNVELLTASLAGFGVGDLFLGGGGTIDEVNCFKAVGVLPFGGTSTVNRVKAFSMSPGSVAVENWGLHISNSEAENYVSKSLVIGGATEKVTNSDVGLEIASKKAFKLTGLTVTERDAMTAELGMMVMIDDGPLKSLQVYDGSSWVTLSGVA